MLPYVNLFMQATDLTCSENLKLKSYLIQFENKARKFLSEKKSAQS